MNNDVVKDTIDFVASVHMNDNSGHDFDHVMRVYGNACELLKNCKDADNFVVEMSALLHDVDDRKINPQGGMVEKYIERANLSEKDSINIMNVINSISFSKSGSKPEFDTIEQKIVSDADKLDAIGAIGAIRTIAYGLASGRELFNKEIFPDENLTKEEYKNPNRKTNNTINHFFDKLLKLKGAMQTEAGRQEAQKRHDFMVCFLRQFFAEQQLSDWLEYLDKYENRK